MEKNGLGKRINTTRKDRGVTVDKLSEMCNINARKKQESMPVPIVGA